MIYMNGYIIPETKMNTIMENGPYSLDPNSKKDVETVEVPQPKQRLQNQVLFLTKK